MRKKKRDRADKKSRISIDDAGELHDDDAATELVDDDAPAAHEATPDDAPPPPIDIDVEAVMAELSDDAAALVRALEAERDDAIAARQRALADYVNFQKRSAANERRALSRGTVEVVRSLMQVIDHFDLAVNQDVQSMTVEQLIGGVQIVRNELAQVLERHDVTTIAPEPGAEFDPMWHEAIMRQPSEDVPPDAVVMTIQPGYRLGEMIVRPAKVIIAEAIDATGEAGKTGAAGADGPGDGGEDVVDPAQE
jgi:molecular chaperone GrpE